jgi:trk system potassium uptake protein TrkA
MLAEESQEVIMIDKSPERISSLKGRVDALLLQGNGASPRFLDNNGASKCDLFLAVTDNDEVNLFAAVAAHHLGARKTVARVSDSEYFGRHEHFVEDVLGVDLVVHPARISAHEIAEALLLPGAVSVEYFADRNFAVAEVLILAPSPLLQKRANEYQTSAPSCVLGVIRAGVAQTVNEQTIYGLGDRILVGAATGKIASVTEELAGRIEDIQTTTVLGGGRIGYELASILSGAGVKVTIAEADRSRAQWLSERLSESRVLHTEGISEEELKDANLENAQAVVSCMGDDRNNLLACLRARQMGTHLTMAVVSRAEYTPMVYQMGIDMAFAPRLITAQAITRFLHAEHVKNIYLLLGGAELLELEVSSKASVINRRSTDIGIPGASVGAIIRGGEILIDTPVRFQVADRAIIFASDGVERSVEKVFES